MKEKVTFDELFLHLMEEETTCRICKGKGYFLIEVGGETEKEICPCQEKEGK